MKGESKAAVALIFKENISKTSFPFVCNDIDELARILRKAFLTESEMQIWGKSLAIKRNFLSFNLFK